MVFTGVKVSNEYKTQDQKVFCVTAWFYKVHEEKGERIENQFYKVNLNDWAWCYTIKHKDEMLPSKFILKYWAEIK